MKAPWKKIFIARYVLMLEVLGFLIMGAIIAGMIFAVFHKIDDDCKVKSDKVTARIEPVALPAKAYVQSVEVRDGVIVKKGQTVASVLDDPTNVSVREARQTLAVSEQSLASATPVAGAAASQTLDSVKTALASSANIAPVGPITPIRADIGGVIKGAGLAAMQGQIEEGQIAEVHNFESLRFPVGVGGKNSDRVNISLLGAKDILDWKHVTGVLKGKESPESGAERWIWSLLNDDAANKEKLKFVAAGKTPDDIGKGDIVSALNGALRKKDFYKPDVWTEADLTQEARDLIAKGPASLSEAELLRLNRLLIEAAFPDSIKKSENTLQSIKAKIIVPKKSLLVNGKEKKVKPDLYELRGKVLTDKDPALGLVMIELNNPPAALTDYMKKRLSDDTLPSPTMTGGIVVGQIPMFRFLFSKE